MPRPSAFNADCLEVCKPHGKEIQRWSHEEADEDAAEEDHDGVSYEKRNAVIDLHGVVWKHVAQEVAAIEWRNRQQIEEAQTKIDVDAQSQQNDDRHQVWKVGHIDILINLKDTLH